MVQREDRPTINYLDSYRPYYGVREDVLIRRLESLKDGTTGLRLELTSHRPDFRYFEMSTDGDHFYCSRTNTFVVRFGDKRSWNGWARPVYDKETGGTYDIEVKLKRREEYEAEGEPLPNRYTVKINPRLDLEARPPLGWSRPLPTEADRRFAEERWGEHLEGCESDYDKAKALARVLCHELWPRSGSPDMKYDSPFGMYRKMMSGESKGFCVQFNMIFVHACRCFGIPARNMHIERPICYGPESWIFLSGMHCTNEIFDREMNRWIFMDIRFYCLGAYLGEEGPLNVGELHLLISQPHWRPRLRFQVYDMEEETEKRLPMKDCPRPDIHFYAGWNTVFQVGYE